MSMRQTTQPLPAPAADGLAGEYFDWHRQCELRVLQCDLCATYVHPPQPSCGACDSEHLHWQRVAGTGSVFTWAVTHRAFHPMFAAELPYIAAIVTLDEGPRLLTMLREIDHQDVEADLRVSVEFEQRENGTAVAVFVPASDPEVGSE